MGNLLLAAGLLIASGWLTVGAAEKSETRISSLPAIELSSHDLKALHYIENAHGQLDDWSFRLLKRLKMGEGPRNRDPILDGRAEMQVQKIAGIYASYTHSEQLRRTMLALADAHDKRLRVLQAMTVSQVNENSFQKLNTPVQELAQALRIIGNQK